MHRLAVLLLAVVACEPPTGTPEPTPPTWVYAPPPTAWPLGEVRGQLGRGQAPQLPLPAGITGAARFPLRQPTPWAVPGPGSARAVIYGLEGVVPAIELIDVDAGAVLWRDAKACAGPIVGVTEGAIVCADASGVRGVKLDGKPAWQSPAPFVAITDDRVVVGPTGESVILDAATGDELSRVKLPAGVIAETVIASCGDAGRELFATGADGKLTRIADARGGPAVAWSVPIGAIDEIDACIGDSVLVRTSTDAGASWVALARATGVSSGRVDGVHGTWRARDGSDHLELASATGVTVWPRDLSGMIEATTLPGLGALLATRGDNRLVRATPLTAVLLDPQGVRAHVPLAAMGAVLGETAIVAGSWSGPVGETVRRLVIPARDTRTVRVLPPRRGVSVPAELRDLPAVHAFDESSAVRKVDTGKHAVAAIAIDPRVPTAVYAVVLERAASDSTTATIARADLATRQWAWQRTDGCGSGTPIALAVADDVIACAARGDEPGEGTVRATSLDGAARWEWEGDAIDTIQAAGDTIVVFDAARAFVLDAATGRLRGQLASDDGSLVRAAAVELDDGTTLLLVYERGRLVARWPRFDLMPVWSLAIDGVIRGLSASGAGVLVDLEHGDAYLVDARTGARVALAGVGLGWQAYGDALTGNVAGGEIPGAYPPRPPGVPLRRRIAQGRPSPEADLDLERPRLWTPIAPPPSLGPSWQFAVYDRTGGLRARNDYGIIDARSTSARGPAGSPFVVTHGPGARSVLVLDPRTGDPLRRVELPEAGGPVFATVVDGSPVAGAVLPQPLRIVLF